MKEIDGYKCNGNVKPDGFDFRSLLAGMDFTVNCPEENSVLEKQMDEASNMDNHFFSELIDDDVVQHVTFAEIKDKLKNCTADGKLKKYIVRQGSGPIPGDVPVFVHYVSWVQDDNTPFDSSYSRFLKPERFTLGVGELYEGFEIAVKTMKQGEVAYFLIHPDLAFKGLGVPPRIPPNATIFIQLYLVTIGLLKEEFKEGSEIIDKRSFCEVHKKIQAEMITGRENFRSGLIRLAINNFRKAERILHSCKLKSDDEESKWKKYLAKTYSNLCVCYNHNSCKQPKLVCIVVAEAFREIPELAFHHPKILYQFGKAKLALDDFKQAEKWFSRALKLKGVENEEILNQLELVRLKMQKDQAYEQIEEDLSFGRIGMDNSKKDEKRSV